MPVPPSRLGKILGLAIASIVVLLVIAGMVSTSWKKSGEAQVARRLAAVFTIDVIDSNDVVLSQGSGFLAGESGLAVSAFHVLAGARRATARFANGRIYDVLNVNTSDEDHDAIVFRIGRRMDHLVEYPVGITPLTFERGKRARVGEHVTVIGSPEGLTNTLTDGLVSALRNDEGSRMIQISAPISPGSSGGPVLDAAGEVVGVVVQQNPEGQNLNFAQPADLFVPLLAPRSAESLVAFGTRTAKPDEASLYDDLFLRGNFLFRRGRYEDALSRYDLATRVAPESTDALYNAAICLDHLGREKDAADHFRRYLALHPPEDDFRRFADRWLETHAAILR